MLLALLAPALAHIPHDTVRGLVVPPDLDPAATWFVLADPHGIPLWERSDDAGRTWDIVRAAPTADLLLDATRLDDGTLVALGERRYWWSVDGGERWEEAPVPAPVRSAGGGERLVLVGDGGVWTGAPGALAPATLVPMVALGPGPSAIDAEGRPWVGVDGYWRRLADPPSPASAVAADADGAWLGTRSGEVYRWDGAGWTACGELPRAWDGAQLDVVLLTPDAGALWAASAWRGPFRSDDGCATWDSRATPEDPVIGGAGGANGPEDTWIELQASGDRLLIGGWGGVYASDDGGRSWHAGPLVSSSYTRGLAFSPNFREDGRVLYGTYGAALLGVTAGGLVVEPRDAGYIDTNIQQVVLPDDPALADHAWSVCNHEGWASTDGGRTWVPETRDVFRVATYFVAPDGLELWAFALDDGQVIERSLDAGATWTRLDSLTAALGASRGQAVAMLPDGTRCVSAIEPVRVVCSPDGGRTWTASLWTDATSSTPVVAWPARDPSRLVLAEPGGVWRSDDGGRAWARAPWPREDEPWSLHVAPDGSLFAGTSGGGLLRSDDGGRSWTDLGVALSTRPRELASRPDFAQVDELLIGTADGAWLLRDARGPSPTVARWDVPDRVDDKSGFVEREGDPEEVARPGAGMGVVRRMPEGTALTAWVRGEGIRVLGLADPADVAEVWVDGALVALVGERASADVEALVEVDGLAWDWHEVRVVGLAGDGVEIDAVEGFGGGELLSDPAPAPAEGCAAAGRRSAAASGVVFLALVGLLARRAPARARRR